ncbi:hypothetical protein D3C84_1275520 [compost metagenome]
MTSITFIIKQRMSYVFHVRPDLVGSSRFQLTGNESHISKTFQDFIMGYCRFSNLRIIKDGHLHAVFQVTG